MKSIKKLTFIAVTAAAFATNAAFADSTNLRQLLDAQRQQGEDNKRDTIDAHNTQGPKAARTGTHYEWHKTLNGQSIGVYVEVR
jgi:hypothetical protein